MYKILLLSIMLTGCSMTVPSFYDDNESKATIDVQYYIGSLNCAQDYMNDIRMVKQKVDWLKLYAKGKGSEDISLMVSLMSKTVDGFYSKTTVSNGYCIIKKKLLIKQSSDVTAAIMGRF